MPGTHKWVFSPVTRHSLILMVAGFTLIATGVSFHKYIPGAPRWEALVVARNVMTLDSWGKVFMGAGVLVVLLAHWKDLARIWGYSVLTGICVGWATFYFVGSFFAPDPVTNLSLGCVWAFQGFVWWAISGLPDTTTWKVRMPLWVNKDE